MDAALARGAVEGRAETFAADERDAEGAPRATPRLVVERVDLRAMVEHRAAWADLSARAIEPNIFLEPAFALPLLQHIHTTGRRPSFLLVWEEDDDTAFGRMVGLMLLSPSLYPGDRIARGLACDLVCLGVPLLDAGRTAETWAALLAWLDTDTPYAALSLTGVPRDGALFRALLEAELGQRCRLLGEHERACLHALDQQAAMPLAPFRSAKRRKEMRRQQRRLADAGRCELVSARTPAEIRRATERFLGLEALGWKGGRRTALLADPGQATFARAMTRLMSLEGKCRIDSLEIDGRPVAMGIVLMAEGRAHFWKTAFDETYARLSPGVQLTSHITETQLAEPSVTMTDSCAVPDHPMINRLWPDRMRLADVLIDLRPAEPGRFARVYAFERFRRAARRVAKSIWERMRRGVASARRKRRWSATGSGSTNSSGSPGWSKAAASPCSWSRRGTCV